MRLRVIFFCLVVAGPAASSADVIHLKNGRQIWADRVRENGAHLEYDVGDNSYAIPSTLVDRVEAGGVAPDIASSPQNSGHGLPTFVPNSDIDVDVDGDLPAKIIHEGYVDADALASLEHTAKPAITAAGYFIAGKHEFDRGNFPQARTYLDTALGLQPDSPTILNYYAAALVRIGMAKQAISYAERSTRLAPNSADSFAVLGFVQFSLDRSKDAIRSWKRSLQLRPDPAVEAYIAKAERETQAEADFAQRASSHFTLRYEGKQTSESLRRAILSTLESEYDDLVRQLGVAPRENIPVILYTNETFFDVTHAPAWSGAVNDGKLRIPVNGVESVNSEMARVLKHELAHSFIDQISHGRCPQWLHEGIAQAVEPKTVSSDGRRLAELFSADREIPFNALEGSFMRFSTMEAILAYDESLAAVEYINDTYGMSELRRILQRIGDGSPTEVALRSTIHSDYGQLQREVGRFLLSKYGS
ncbi:MAG TPA: peptidase MA family metallohydrolase [Terriglobales bacterium]|nr:peptidase MA family metallohydrolase [Terriglobales bacterium]